MCGRAVLPKQKGNIRANGNLDALKGIEYKQAHLFVENVKFQDIREFSAGLERLQDACPILTCRRIKEGLRLTEGIPIGAKAIIPYSC